MRTAWSLIAISIFLLAGCKARPLFNDNGNPGKIKASIFYDDNRNGVQDNGEAGFQARIGISQDISCPPSSLDKITFLDTDPNGTVVFADLKPGKYCVGADGNRPATTKLTVDIYVSSDTVSAVSFGVTKE